MGIGHECQVVEWIHQEEFSVQANPTNSVTQAEQTWDASTHSGRPPPLLSHDSIHSQLWVLGRGGGGAY